MPKKKNLQNHVIAPFTFIRREFLNLAPSQIEHTSYVLCHVENSDSGRQAHGSNMLHVADCYRVTSFDFYLGNAEARDASIAKLNLLLEILGEFREALLNEAYLIAEIEKAGG